MCGRFTMFSDDAELVSLFDIDEVEGEHQRTYNQAPAQLVRSVTSSYTDDDEERILGLQQWGLVPSWAKEGFKPLINARSETVTTKPAFRSAAIRRRCLVPTNGYFEWRKLPGGKKQPYFLSLGDSRGRPAPAGSEPVIAMAGIYELSDEGVPTVALLTRAASPSIAFIHDRMPLFLTRDLWTPWLDPTQQKRDVVEDMINIALAPPLVAREVGAAVGNVRNDFPGLIDAVDPGDGMLPL